MQDNQPKTCLGNARISDRGQITGESLDDQVRMMEVFARDKGFKILPDGKIAKEINSAKKRRPVYENHVQYIKDNPGKVGYYLIRYIDRFSRGGVAQYEQMKYELEELGVMLIDTSGIIQPSRNMPEMEELGFEYSWSKESPSKWAETMVAVVAEEEGERILKRTITKQIKYTQAGYQISRPDDGCLNKQIDIGIQKRFIQVPDPDRAHFIIKIFELRAEGKHSDQEIIKILNEDMGYRTKPFKRWNKEKTDIIGQGGGNKLCSKRLQRIYQRPVYAGVMCKKWTHNKPIKTQWNGLVSIELWNKANRGKLHIKEYEDGVMEMLYDYRTEKPVFQRLRHNPEYPFKCVCCPECGNPLKGSAPRGKCGKYYPRYHCERGHKSFSVSREQMDKTVGDFLRSVEYDDDYLQVLEAVLVKKLRKRQKDIVQESQKLNERVALLKAEQQGTLSAIIATKNITVKGMLEKELVRIVGDIKRAEAYRFSVDLTEDDISELVSYAKKIVELPEKTLIDKDNPLRQKQLFQLFFEDLPTYENLVSGTPKKRFLFNRKCVAANYQTSEESQSAGVLSLEWNSFQEMCLGWLTDAKECMQYTN